MEFSQDIGLPLVLQIYYENITHIQALYRTSGSSMLPSTIVGNWISTDLERRAHH